MPVTASGEFGDEGESGDRESLARATYSAQISELQALAILNLGLDLLNQGDFRGDFVESFTSLVNGDEQRAHSHRVMFQNGIMAAPIPSRMESEGPIQMVALAIKRLFVYGEITARIKADDALSMFYPEAHERMCWALGILDYNEVEALVDAANVETRFTRKQREGRRVMYRELQGDYGHYLVHQIVPIKHPKPDGGIVYRGRYEQFRAFDMWGRPVGLPLTMWVPNPKLDDEWVINAGKVQVMPVEFNFNYVFSHARDTSTIIGIPSGFVPLYHQDRDSWRAHWDAARAGRLNKRYKLPPEDLVRE